MSFSESGGGEEGNPLQCPLCMLPYDNKKHEAKLLTCHHSFCLACTTLMADAKPAIKCPTCRKRTPVPKKGARALQTNFYISQMREVMSGVASTTKPRSRTTSSTTSDSGGGGGGGGGSNGASDNCAKHSGQPLLFFCETCSEPICMNCTVLDHEKAAGHVITDIAKVISSFREVLSGKAANITGALERRRAKLAGLRTELGCLDITHDVAAERIAETFAQLKAKLDQRQAKLVHKLGELHAERKAAIVRQAQVLRAETKRLHEALTHVETLSTTGTVSAVVTAAINAKSIAELDTMCLNVQLGEPTRAHLQFKFDKGLKTFVDAVNHVGDVVGTQDVPAEVTYSVQPVMTAGHTAIIQVVTRDGHHELMPTKDLSLVVVDPEGEQLPVRTITPPANKKESLTVELRPQVGGEHQAVLQFMQRPLSSATKAFTVAANNPVQVIGEPGTGNGQLNRPTSVAVSPKGHIYVADMGNKRVQIFSSAGKPMGQFKVGSTKTTTYDVCINSSGAASSAPEVLCTKVAPDPASGHMVADTVRAFDLSGEKKHQTVLRGATNALFLAVSARDGGLAVTDSATHSVHLYTAADHTPTITFGSYGADTGLFNFPSAICFGGGPKDEKIFVSDTRNHRVQVFDRAGNFLLAFGSEGKGRGQFRSPRGIAADTQGHVLVADSCNRIQVFTADGKYVSTIESEADPINEPYNMDTTPDGHVYLADFKSCCVKKYKYL